MKDWQTNSETDAGKADRATAWREDLRDWDEGGPVIDTGHDCTYAPFPDSCVSCLVWERHWIRERAAVDAANDKEWNA